MAQEGGGEEGEEGGAEEVGGGGRCGVRAELQWRIMNMSLVGGNEGGNKETGNPYLLQPGSLYVQSGSPLLRAIVFSAALVSN